MDPMLAGIAFPLRMREFRRNLTSGLMRDTHGISLKERATARVFMEVIKHQMATVRDAHPRDVEEEEAVLRDMVNIYIAAFYRLVLHVPRPRRVDLYLENVSLLGMH